MRVLARLHSPTLQGTKRVATPYEATVAMDIVMNLRTRGDGFVIFILLCIVGKFTLVLCVAVHVRTGV